MEQLLVTSNDELCKWLDERRWFLESHVRAFSPKPAAPDSNSNPPPVVSFQFASGTGGSRLAGEKNIQRCFELKATGAEEWSCISKLSEDHAGYVYIQDVDVPGIGNKIKIVIDDDIKLTCSEIKITDLGKLIAINKPQLSIQNLVIEVNNHEYPQPKDWVEWFAAAGCEISWRRHYDKAVKPEEVPENDYEGWMLQKPEFINETSGGLMVFSCRNKGTGFRTIFQSYSGDKRIDAILRSATGELARLFTDVRIECGNCIFTGDTWADCQQSSDQVKFLMDKFIPPGTAASDLI